ncbi:hypothetical protein DSECCO2_499460 [anaerobic digester metagenome]
MQCFFGQLNIHAFDFVNNATSLHRSAPANRRTLAFTLTYFQGLGSDRLVGEDSNEDLSASFDMSHHRDTGGFDLLARDLSTLHGLQTDITKSNRGRTLRQAAYTTLLLLPKFYFLGTQHQLSTSLRISPLNTHTLMPMTPYVVLANATP